MKKNLLSLSAAILLTTVFVQAQDIPKSQVPSVILNKFETSYPKATDIEWEMDGDLYNVEFEIGRDTDHDAWYDASGNEVRHKEEIPSSKLPASVTQTLESDFKGYRIDDVEKITTPDAITYSMELDSPSEEWQVIIDDKGAIVDQRRD